jgi:hypothetical protein
VHSAMVYGIQVCRQLSSRSRMDLVGFIIKKFVTMHGHTNVKFDYNLLLPINAHSEIYITVTCAFVGIKRF